MNRIPAAGRFPSDSFRPPETASPVGEPERKLPDAEHRCGVGPKKKSMTEIDQKNIAPHGMASLRPRLMGEVR